MLKLFVLNYLIDTNNSSLSNDVVLAARGLRRGAPPVALCSSIRAALEQVDFQFHRTCSACDLNTAEAISYGIEQSMVVSDFKNVISVEGVVGTSSVGNAVSAVVTMATVTDFEGAAGVPIAASSGTEPTSTATDLAPIGRREMRSTSQQTIISCRCSPAESVCDGDAEVPDVGATTLRTSSILGSVCALLLNKRGVDIGPGQRADANASTDKDGGSPGSRRSDQICRICFGGESSERLVRPCSCRGTIAAVHRSCLERWLQQAASSYCELCRHHYSVTRTHKWSWARSALEWAVSGRGRALVADVLRGAALAAASTLGTARALHLCDRALYAASRRGGGAALAANVFSSLLIGIIEFVYLNNCLPVWLCAMAYGHANPESSRLSHYLLLP
ncbi:E3 ubiquitin-protein ligase MARCH3 [Eumeta japonica]|uniref:E3 ubiquitin-protein ligase MARCH3 n=1 Tax=Eumeta variegata TaxID=151549 RepID=A0A4C1ZA12_EUMVA|nr:E3 ubiquitin-protein ligase MARCH3 [Eumeta japonica]